jgi:hypothetical protein
MKKWSLRDQTPSPSGSIVVREKPPQQRPSYPRKDVNEKKNGTGIFSNPVILPVPFFRA